MASAVVVKSFESASALEEMLSRPSPELVADLAEVDGDIIVIGVGGKMGPTLAQMAKRAAPDKRVIGVSRFSEPGLEASLKACGVETIAVDLADAKAVAELPRVKNVIFMAGRKFGSAGSEETTWAMNAFVPAIVAQHFSSSRIVAYSTICVYPFAEVLHGGSSEDDAVGPPGEYAMSCVGRERMFQYFSRKHDTAGAIIRLSYAIDMRYGVLHEVARKVFAGEAIDVTTGHVNVIWQGDACSQSLRALRHCTVPSVPINVSGPETVSIRAVATEFGRRFGKSVEFIGKEAPTAWLANTGRAAALFGYPTVPLEWMIDWTADWVARDMVRLDKSTHFQVRSGQF